MHMDKKDVQILQSILDLYIRNKIGPEPEMEKVTGYP